MGGVGTVDVVGFVGTVGSMGTVGSVTGWEVVPPGVVGAAVVGKVAGDVTGLVGRSSMEDSSITTGTSRIKRMANSRLQAAIKKCLVIKIVL